MTILRDISLIWSMLHIIIIFLMLFRSRYAKRKTIILGAVCMAVLAMLNMGGLFLLGVETMGKLLLLTCSIPSFVFFYFISEDKSAGFLFTFCLVDTVCYWLLNATNLLDYYLGGERFILMFAGRLVAFPLLEYLIYKRLRALYLELQQMVKRGWGAYACMTVLYYILLVIMFEFPVRITARPEHLPAFLLVMLLMVLNYIIIFFSLYHQYKIYEQEKAERVLQEQKLSLEAQLENQQHIRRLRHDMRGHTITLQGLLKAGKEQQALEYLDAMERSIVTVPTSVCTDPYLNAQLAHYVQKFHALGVDLAVDIRLGEGALPYTEVCSIVSNALENAWEESRILAPNLRSASVKMKHSRDYLVIRLRNRCRDGLVVERGTIPHTNKEGKDHGLGLRSIRETAQKLGGDMTCYTENGDFVLDVMLRPGADGEKGM